MGADVLTELQPIATAVGEAWASDVVRSLRMDDRDVIGAWPGTMSEARMRIRMALKRQLDADVLDALARIANVTARQNWLEISIADPEP